MAVLEVRLGMSLLSDPAGLPGRVPRASLTCRRLSHRQVVVRRHLPFTGGVRRSASRRLVRGLSGWCRPPHRQLASASDRGRLSDDQRARHRAGSCGVPAHRKGDQLSVPSDAYPDLGHHGNNWVTKAGGLPRYIERIAKHIHYEHGRPVGVAIAMAVNDVKRMCATGESNFGHVGPPTQKEACAAVAEWEAKLARSHAK